MPYKLNYADVPLHRGIFESAQLSERKRNILQAVRETQGHTTIEQAADMFPEEAFSPVDICERLASALINNYVSTNPAWNIVRTVGGEETSRQAIPKAEARVLENLFAKMTKSDYGTVTINKQEIEMFLRAANADCPFIFGSSALHEYVQGIYDRGEIVESV